jgi:co-chaperonin GroES (HSP10)
MSTRIEPMNGCIFVVADMAEGTIGTGTVAVSGSPIVNAGDEVLFYTTCNHTTEIDGVEYTVINEVALIAKVS